MAWAFEQPIPCNLKIVLLALADHANDAGKAWPSLDRVAEKSSLSRRSVIRSIKSLSEKPYGLLAVIYQFDASGRQTVSSYHLHLDLACQPAIQPSPHTTTPCGEGDSLSPRGEGDKHDKGRVTNTTGEGDTHGTPKENLILEPSEEKEKRREDPLTPPAATLVTHPQGVGERFEAFWAAYPTRNGKRLERAETFRRFRLLTDEDQGWAVIAAAHYAASQMVREGLATKDPKRFLRDGHGGELWRDWLTPEVPHRPASKVAKALTWRPPELRGRTP